MSGGIEELHAELDALSEQPVARQAQVLERLHGRLTGELDALVIPRAEARSRG